MRDSLSFFCPFGMKKIEQKKKKRVMQTRQAGRDKNVGGGKREKNSPKENDKKSSQSANRTPVPCGLNNCLTGRGDNHYTNWVVVQ